MSETWGSTSQRLLSKKLLVTSKPDAEVCAPITQLGVSVAYLRALINAMSPLLEVVSTADFVSKALNTLTLKKRTRFQDLIPSEYLGPPHYYVVHAWQGSFLDLVTAIETHVQDADEVAKDTYVWLDWVAMSQHTSVTNQTEMGHVRELVSICSKGALITMDSKLTLLNRSWCLYEIWCFLYYGDLYNISVSWAGPLETDILLKYFAMIPKLDLTRSEASKQQDYAKIISAVKSSVGIKRFHLPLKDALAMSVRREIRWSKNLRDVAVYCITLLKMGEYGHLQQVLSSIPQLAEDDRTLQDIRAIYKMYDTDGSGSLDEDEFVEVLATAGFSRREALDIFAEVNTDGDDGVDLEEFESWWINVYKAKVGCLDCVLQPPVLKKKLLITNMGKMATYLDHVEIHDLAEIFRFYNREVEAGKLLGSHYPEDLNSNPLRGNWHSDSEVAIWKLHQGDVRTAMNMMYEIFHLNAEQLALDPKLLLPPAKLDCPVALCKVLMLYIEVEICLLALEWEEDVLQMIGIFQKLVDKMKQPGGLSKMAQSLGAVDVKKNAGTDNVFGKFSVVRRMVLLKYGNAPASWARVAEAEKSIGVLKAAPKEQTEYSVSHYLGQDSEANTSEHVALPMHKVFRHEIPAEGPYRSVLADLGPDAQKFLTQLKEAQEADDDALLLYAEEGEEAPREKPHVAKERKERVRGPSFDIIRSSRRGEGGGAFAKVAGGLTRVGAVMSGIDTSMLDTHGSSKSPIPGNLLTPSRTCSTAPHKEPDLSCVGPSRTCSPMPPKEPDQSRLAPSRTLSLVPPKEPDPTRMQPVVSNSLSTRPNAPRVVLSPAPTAFCPSPDPRAAPNSGQQITKQMPACADMQQGDMSEHLDMEASMLVAASEMSRFSKSTHGWSSSCKWPSDTGLRAAPPSGFRVSIGSRADLAPRACGRLTAAVPVPPPRMCSDSQLHFNQALGSSLYSTGTQEFPSGQLSPGKKPLPRLRGGGSFEGRRLYPNAESSGHTSACMSLEAASQHWLVSSSSEDHPSDPAHLDPPPLAAEKAFEYFSPDPRPRGRASLDAPRAAVAHSVPLSNRLSSSDHMHLPRLRQAALPWNSAGTDLPSMNLSTATSNFWGAPQRVNFTGSHWEPPV